MPLLTLISGQRPKRVKISDNDNAADILLIDATISETTAFESEVTDLPVEEGPDVNDHIRPKPVVYEIEGEISETPLTLDEDLAGLVSGKAASVTNLARGFGGGVVSQLSSRLGSQVNSNLQLATGIAGAALLRSGGNPAEVARTTLEQLITNRTRFTIQSKYKSYSNMVLTSLSFPRANSDGKKLRFTARAKQINVVQGETVDIQKLARSAAGGAAAKSKLGNQAASAANQEVSGKASLLKQTFNFLSGGR